MTETKETLKSLLKAEDKNRVEENRLRNLLKDLELHKRRRHKEHFNDIFQQKRLVYKTKRELTDAIKVASGESNKPKKSRLLMKYKNLRPGRLALSDGNATFTEVTDDSVTVCGDQAHGEDQYVTDRRLSHQGPSLTLPKIVEEEDGVLDTARLGSTNRRRPRLFKQNSMPDIRMGTYGVNKQAKLSVNNLKQFNGIKEAEVDDEINKHKDAENCSREVKSGKDVVKFPSVICHMLGEEPHNDAADAVPSMDVSEHLENTMLTCSFDLRNIALKAKEDQQDVIRANKGRQRLMHEKSYWVGDPIAVRSVRRERTSVHSMLNKMENVSRIQHMLYSVDPAHKCSRNCNRPGSEFSINDFPQSIPFYEHRAQLNKNRRLTKEILTAYDQYNHQEKGFDEKRMDELRQSNESLAAILVKYDDLVREQKRQRQARTSSLPATIQHLQKKFEEVKGQPPVVVSDTVIQDANNETRVVVGLEYKTLQKFRTGDGGTPPPDVTIDLAAD